MFGRAKVKPGRFYDYDPKTKQAVRVHSKQFEEFKARNQAERALPLSNRYQLAARSAVDVLKAVMWSDGKHVTEDHDIACPNCEAKLSRNSYRYEKNEVGLFDLVYVCQRCGFRWFVPNSVIKNGG